VSTRDYSLPAIGLVMPLASQEGGAENLFMHLLRSSSLSFRYTCLFLQDGPLVNEAKALGYETAVLPTTHLSDVWNYIKTVAGIREWIRHSRLELVFSWMLKAHLYASPAAFSLRTKQMWFQHGISKRHWMDLLGACLPANGILCCSGYVKDTQDKRFPARPTFVCHPGVPMSSRTVTSRGDARDQLGLPLDAEVICMVARLERWKGAHVLVEAAGLLAQKFPKANFYIVGGVHPMDQEYADELRQLIAVNSLGNRLQLVGKRPLTEIPLWHASADMIVHPVTEAEPFGMAIVEALAARRAVVASRAGGISEIIEDGVSGVFVAPSDAVALASAVSRLLLDGKTRERIECAAKVRSRTFSVEAFVTRFENQVSAVLAT
jgi:glycosyltransferase involved in cell wall biosynthesis